MPSTKHLLKAANAEIKRLRAQQNVRIRTTVVDGLGKLQDNADLTEKVSELEQALDVAWKGNSDMAIERDALAEKLEQHTSDLPQDVIDVSRAHRLDAASKNAKYLTEVANLKDEILTLQSESTEWEQACESLTSRLLAATFEQKQLELALLKAETELGLEKAHSADLEESLNTAEGVLAESPEQRAAKLAEQAQADDGASFNEES